MRNVITFVAAIALLSSTALTQQATSSPAGNNIDPACPAIRKISAIGDNCIAVGDAGTILKSSDGGATWQSVECDRRINLQSICRNDKTTYIMGGYGLAGHPQGWGQGVVLAGDSECKSLHAIPTDGVGWIYDGIVTGQGAAVVGQSNAIFNTGMLCTSNAGASWNPISLPSSGYLLAADFASPMLGWVGGSQCHLVELRQMQKGFLQPPPVKSPATINAIHYAGAETFWATGENGTVLYRRQAKETWTVMAVKLPAGTRRLADFRAIASDRSQADAESKRVWIAGGTIGIILFSADGGANWSQLPAPGPGPINDLKWLAGDTLLACGDAGRIWRSDDAGKTWRQTCGSDKTDILFITSPADAGAYPAIVMHALAGCNVAVLHVTLPFLTNVPGDQPLRAAAISAGARGVAAMSDFASLVGDAAAAKMSQAEIIKRWSQQLDVPAEEEMLKQIVAAIRQYRPAVVVTCGQRDGTVGADGEMNIISGLVQKGAAISGDEKLYPELADAGLVPFAPQRVFVGQLANNNWSRPWRKFDAVDTAGSMTVINSRLFPPNSQVNVEMYSLCAAWQLPWFGIDDRPSPVCGYYCQQLQSRVGLFTAGITKHSINVTSPNEDFATLADTAALDLAAESGAMAVSQMFIKKAQQYANTPAGIMAADRLLLAWQLLLQQGQLGQAQEAMDAFVKFGTGHPLYDRISLVALGDLLSREWLSQIAMQAPSVAEKLQGIPAFANALAKMYNWNSDATGTMLTARALLAAGQKEQAALAMARLQSGGFGPYWRTVAMTEGAAIAGRPSPDEIISPKFHVPPSPPQGKPDGMLDDPFWKNIPKRPLLPAGAAAGTPPEVEVQLTRLPTAVVIGARILDKQNEKWIVEVAADIDRDCMVQFLGRCNSAGESSVQILRRAIQPTKINEKPFQFLKSKTGDDQTFEILIPPSNVGANPKAALVWNMQIRAAPVGGDGKIGQWRYLTAQPDDELLPERYSQFLIAPPQADSGNAPAQPQNSPK